MFEKRFFSKILSTLLHVSDVHLVSSLADRICNIGTEIIRTSNDVQYAHENLKNYLLNAKHLLVYRIHACLPYADAYLKVEKKTQIIIMPHCAPSFSTFSSFSECSRLCRNVLVHMIKLQDGQIAET